MSDDSDVPSLEREADSLLGRGSASEEVLASITELCSGDFLYFPCYDIIGLPSPLVFYAVVEIAMRFGSQRLQRINAG